MSVGTKHNPLEPKKWASRGNLIRIGFGLAVTAISLYAVFSAVQLDAIAEALASFDLRFAVLGLLALSAGYLLRIVRWAVMLSAGSSEITIGRCAGPYLASIALNNVLPLRAGDVIRAFAFPSAMGISRSQSLASLVFERALDLAALLGLFAIGLAGLGDSNVPGWIINSAQSLLAITVLAIIVCFVGIKSIQKLIRWMRMLPGLRDIGILGRVFDFGLSTLAEISTLTRGGRIWEILGLTLGIWVLEASVFASAMYGLGDEVQVAGVSLIASLATIATLAPSSPGYFGPFHLAAFEGYKLLFDEPGRAAALAVLAHVMIWLPTTIAGLIGLAFIRRSTWASSKPHTEG